MNKAKKQYQTPRITTVKLEGGTELTMAICKCPGPIGCLPPLTDPSVCGGIGPTGAFNADPVTGEFCDS